MFGVSFGLLDCFVKLNVSILQLRHKKGNLVINNVPEIVQ